MKTTYEFTAVVRRGRKSRIFDVTVYAENLNGAFRKISGLANEFKIMNQVREDIFIEIINVRQAK